MSYKIPHCFATWQSKTGSVYEQNLTLRAAIQITVFSWFASFSLLFFSLMGHISAEQHFDSYVEVESGMNNLLLSKFVLCYWHWIFFFLVSQYSTHVVCFNFIRDWRNLKYYFGPERQISEKPFHCSFFFRNLLRGSRRSNIFHISFLMTDLGYVTRVLSLISRHNTY